MDLNALSKSALALEKIDAVTDPDQILEALTGFLRSFGFRDLLITGLPLPGDGPWQQAILYDGWSTEWFERYASAGHFANDPCAVKCRTAGKPFLWHELSRAEMFPEQLRVMNEASEFGMLDGLCVPIHLPLRLPAVVTAAGEAIQACPSELPVFEMVCFHAFRALQQSQAENEDPDRNRLTHREKEILKWMSEGKSAEDVACILGISKLTVDRHLKNIREKLDAINTLHAIVKATKLGDIYL